MKILYQKSRLCHASPCLSHLVDIHTEINLPLTILGTPWNTREETIRIPQNFTKLLGLWSQELKCFISRSVKNKNVGLYFLLLLIIYSQTLLTFSNSIKIFLSAMKSESKSSHERLQRLSKTFWGACQMDWHPLGFQYKSCMQSTLLPLEWKWEKTDTTSCQKNHFFHYYHLKKNPRM